MLPQQGEQTAPIRLKVTEGQCRSVQVPESWSLSRTGAEHLARRVRTHLLWRRRRRPPSAWVGWPAARCRSRPGSCRSRLREDRRERGAGGAKPPNHTLLSSSTSKSDPVRVKKERKGVRVSAQTNLRTFNVADLFLQLLLQLDGNTNVWSQHRPQGCPTSAPPPPRRCSNHLPAGI